ncbi:glycosyltransferase [Azospirillum sp.]|uniref:glycosyltransferase n=1 Tax=Azospirillum sp. TaxID=34012 RepID=UPI003D72C23D
MRVSIITYGSQGDVRPLVALGAGLVRAGHSVVFPADREFRPLIERHGLEHRPLSGDVRAVTQGDAASTLFRRGVNPVQLTRALVRMAQDYGEAWTREYLEASRGCDLLVTAGLCFYTGIGIAESLGIPWAGVGLQPMGPTRAFPPPLMKPPAIRLPGVVNVALHLALMQVIWQGFRPSINRARRSVLGLPPMPLAGPGPRMMREEPPLLYAHSPQVLPKPADWPAFCQVTGFWFLDEGAGWEPPVSLRRFLDDGPPPVYVGFGSMGGYDPAATTALVLEALGDRRAVLSAGWGGLDATALPPTVYGLEAAPHDWLFPRMAAVVHHGGAGTTAAALRAGVPGFVVPFLGDQPFWGARVHALGVGPAPLSRAELTPSRLAAALALMDDPDMRARAVDLGARIQAEDGVATAVRILEAAVR